jgi:hypothetical protein
VAVDGIPIFDRLATIFARLEFAGLLYLIHFAGESSGYTSLKSGHSLFVHCCGMGPASGRLYPKNMSLACAATAKKPPLRKIIFELNRCLANSPTHISGYFSGLEEASIRHEGRYIEEKKRFSPRFTTRPVDTHYTLDRLQ